MTGIDLFAWIVFLVIIVSVVYVFVVLAMLPGKIAKGRGHPYAEAINVAGWLGMLLTAGLFWAAAVVWALTAPKQDADDTASLEARVAEVERQLASMGAADE